MEERENFYVYAHYKLDGTVPFYIGKGFGKRAWKTHKSNRGKHWLNIVNKYGLRVELIENNLIEEKAFQLEIGWILFYGRLDLGTGPLINLTDGGEGLSGHIFSKETRKRMGESQRGKRRSEESKEKMSISHKGKKRPPVSSETKEKLSISLKGRKLTDEHKKKLKALVGPKAAFYGKYHTPETKKKMSTIKKGKRHTKESKEKMSISKKGQIPWNKGKQLNRLDNDY